MMINNHISTVAGNGSPATFHSQITHNNTNIEEAILLMQNMRRSNDHYDEYGAVLTIVFRRIITKELDKQ